MMRIQTSSVAAAHRAPSLVHWSPAFTPPGSTAIAQRISGKGREVSDVHVRPVSPSDGDRIQQLVRRLSLESRRARFFSPIRELSPEQLERMTRMAFPEAVALVAESPGPGEPTIVATAQYACDEDGPEFAVLVDDSWHGRGIGRRLVRQLLAVAGIAGFPVLRGFVLASNAAMLALARSLGFALSADRDPTLVRVEKPLVRARLAT